MTEIKTENKWAKWHVTSSRLRSGAVVNGMSWYRNWQKYGPYAAIIGHTPETMTTSETVVRVHTKWIKDA